MGVDLTDVYVELKPHEQWTSANSREELVETISKALEDGVPDAIFSFSQPIELHVSELISGVRSDVAIKLSGDDLDARKKYGDQIAVPYGVAGRGRHAVGGRMSQGEITEQTFYKCKRR